MNMSMIKIISMTVESTSWLEITKLIGIKESDGMCKFAEEDD